MAEQKKKSTQRPKGPSSNTVKAKQAERDTAVAGQKTAETNLEIEKEKTKREEAKEARRKEQSSVGNQVRDIALVAAPIAAGVAYGKSVANKIAADTEKINKAKAANLKAVADGLREASDTPDKPGALITDKNKLKAGVTTAKKQRLMKGKGKAGLGVAAILAVEGVAARVGAGYIENETMQEVVNAAGTGLTVAGGTVLATRALQRGAEGASVNAADAATVAAAEDALNNKTGAPGEKVASQPPAAEPAKTRKPRDPASKKMIKGMSGASQPPTPKAAPAKAAGKAVGKAVAKGALRALGPVATVAAVATAVAGSAQAGESTAQQVGSGVVAAADSMMFGVPGMVSEAVKSKETIAYDAKEAARQANRASAEKKLAAGGKMTRAEAAAIAETPKKPSNDLSTADRVLKGGVGVMAVAVGSGMVADGHNAATYRQGPLKGKGLKAAGITLAVSGLSELAQAAAGKRDAVTSRIKGSDTPEPTPRETGQNGPKRLNEAQKAQLREANARIEKTRAAAKPAEGPQSDGMTEAYRRRGPEGQIVQVQGYRTTLPSR